MRKCFGFVAIVVACGALFSTAGCADDPEQVVLTQSLSATTGGAELPLCRHIAAKLHGREVSVFPLKDQEDIVAIDLDDHIVCFDVRETALRVGFVTVSPRNSPLCDICDGTPLPAERIRPDRR